MVHLKCWIARGGIYVGSRIAATHQSSEHSITTPDGKGSLPNSSVSRDVRADDFTAVRHAFWLIPKLFNIGLSQNVYQQWLVAIFSVTHEFSHLKQLYS